MSLFKFEPKVVGGWKSAALRPGRVTRRMLEAVGHADVREDFRDSDVASCWFFKASRDLEPVLVYLIEQLGDHQGGWIEDIRIRNCAEVNERMGVHECVCSRCACSQCCCGEEAHCYCYVWL